MSKRIGSIVPQEGRAEVERKLETKVRKTGRPNQGLTRGGSRGSSLSLGFMIRICFYKIIKVKRIAIAKYCRRLANAYEHN